MWRFSGLERTSRKVSKFVSQGVQCMAAYSPHIPHPGPPDYIVQAFLGDLMSAATCTTNGNPHTSVSLVVVTWGPNQPG